jgi:dipeptidyl aminopeptidase/acylaminoacyl peptidase
LLVCAAAALAASSLAGQETTPLAVDDAVSMRRFAPFVPIQLSPDGELVAYSVVNAHERSPLAAGDVRSSRGVPQSANGSELWIATIATGDMRYVGGGKRGGSAWGASWSPDGRRLAYFSDADGEVSIWVWVRESGRSRRISRAVIRPGPTLDAPRWMADGRQVVARTVGRNERRRSEASSHPVRAGPRIEHFVFHPDSGRAELDTRARSEVVAAWYVSDLAAIDVESGAVRVLARAEPIVAHWVSPGGDLVAYTRMRSDLRAGTNLGAYDLVVASLRAGSTRVVARGIAHASGANVSWSPDGRRLAFFSAPLIPRDSAELLGAGCYVVLATGDSLRSVGLARPARVGSLDVPTWDRSGRFIYAVADGRLLRLSADGGGELVLKVPEGREVLAIATRAQGGQLPSGGERESVRVIVRDTATLRQGVARIPAEGGEPEVLSEGDQSLVGGATSFPHVFRLDAVGARLIALRESAGDPPDLWVWDAGGREPRRVTRVNPALSRYRFGTSRIVSWMSDDGVPLRGALILPPDYTPERTYPLVLYVYGGWPLSQWAATFGGFLSDVHDVQLFATRGYAVFLPDAPQQVGSPSFDLAKAVLPGVSRLVEMGIADPNRLAVVGHSYGGYSVYSLITQTQRFRAAVVSAGTANLLGAYATMIGGTGLDEYVEAGQGKIGASLWEARERFIDNSPIFHFDRVRTPVLITHGARDAGVPVWSADEAFVALRRLGREVEYVRYLDEEHSEWSGGAKADVAARILKFLDEHVGDRGGGVRTGASSARALTSGEVERPARSH